MHDTRHTTPGRFAALLALVAALALTAGCGRGVLIGGPPGDGGRPSPGAETPSGSGGRDEDEPTAAQSATVYRVQLGILDTAAEADSLASEARAVTDLPVYVLYIAPFYRVQAGDIATKDSAVEWTAFFRKSGFSSARYVFRRDDAP